MEVYDDIVTHKNRELEIGIPEEPFEQQVKKKKLAFCRNKLKIGQGTFGHGKCDYDNPYTGERRVVALKKLVISNVNEGFPITAIREIILLKKLKHQNIVELQDIFISRESEANEWKGSFYLQFEYLKHDLQGLIEQRTRFELKHLKCIMQQVLQGLVYKGE